MSRRHGMQQASPSTFDFLHFHLSAKATPSIDRKLALRQLQARLFPNSPLLQHLFTARNGDVPLWRSLELGCASTIRAFLREATPAEKRKEIRAAAKQAEADPSDSIFGMYVGGEGGVRCAAAGADVGKRLEVIASESARQRSVGSGVCLAHSFSFFLLD